MKPGLISYATLALLAASLVGCGLLPKVGPDYQPAAPIAPTAWQAVTPLPHNGDPAELADWWRQWDDPLLADLIAAVEADNVGLAQAWARIQQARNEMVTAGVAERPSLDASLNVSRATVAMAGPVLHQVTRQVGLMSNWEIDLFGGIARRQEATEASYAASRSRWHEARVSLAAETAQAFLQTRFLERRLQLAGADLASRRETARITRQLNVAGFQSNQIAALADAAAAESAASLTSLRADYDQQIKALVALSGIAEPELRSRLAARRGQFAQSARFRIDSLPAALLAQRPDIAAAERDVAAASAVIGQAESYRYPRLQLLGSLTPLRLTTDGSTISTTTWSIGAGLEMPLINGGRIDANIDAAKAQYAAAAAQYRQKARDAVREVEQALVRLDAAGQREADLRQAAAGYQQAFSATRSRYLAGLAEPLELEEVSRLALAADTNLAAWQHEQAAAWVALYRAVGGGWQAGSSVPTQTTTPIAQNQAGKRS